MATIAPTPTWSMGNVVQYTKEAAVTDDTEQWSMGNVLSFLEYELSASYILAANININLNCNITISAGRAQ